jgi:hypothetical protein
VFVALYREKVMISNAWENPWRRKDNRCGQRESAWIISSDVILTSILHVPSRVRITCDSQ